MQVCKSRHSSSVNSNCGFQTAIAASYPYDIINDIRISGRKMLMLVRTLSRRSRCYSTSCGNALSAASEQRVSGSRTREIDARGAEWFLQLASLHAPEIEIRALPKNSFVGFVMSRRPDIRSSAVLSASPESPFSDRQWTPLIMQTCVKPRERDGMFCFNDICRQRKGIGTAGDGDVTWKNVSLVKMCPSLGILWIFPPSGISGRGRQFQLNGRYSKYAMTHEENYPSFQERLVSSLAHPDSIHKTWEEWLIMSQCNDNLRRSRELQAQLLNLPGFESLRFGHEHNALHNATCLGEKLLIRTASFVTQCSPCRTVIRLRRYEGGSRTYRCIRLDEDFHHVVVLMSTLESPNKLRKVGILSKAQLFDLGYIAGDAEASGGGKSTGRTNVYFMPDCAMSFGRRRVTIPDAFIDVVESSPDEIKAFVERNFSRKGGVLCDEKD